MFSNRNWQVRQATREAADNRKRKSSQLQSEKLEDVTKSQPGAVCVSEQNKSEDFCLNSTHSCVWVSWFSCGELLNSLIKYIRKDVRVLGMWRRITAAFFHPTDNLSLAISLTHFLTYFVRFCSIYSTCWLFKVLNPAASFLHKHYANTDLWNIFSSTSDVLF